MAFYMSDKVILYIAKSSNVYFLANPLILNSLMSDCGSWRGDYFPDEGSLTSLLVHLLLHSKSYGLSLVKLLFNLSTDPQLSHIHQGYVIHLIGKEKQT